MENLDIPYWMAVHDTLGTSFSTVCGRLLKHYGSLGEFWQAKDHVPVPGLKEETRQRLILGRKNNDPHKLWSSCKNRGICAVTFIEKEFSKELLQIQVYPCILYYYGNLNLLNTPSTAIVGTRRPSAYGLMQSRIFSEALAGQGICVVSGMAEGIDGAAHEGALKAGARTIAVLGTGIDVAYPKSHQKLYERLCREALVISSFPPGTPPRKWQFPQRNQIISGLAQQVLLIEAQARSGALITCDLALEQGKDVCALPGPVTNPGSIGPLRLIQQGAKLVITPQDVMVDFENSAAIPSAANCQTALAVRADTAAVSELGPNERKIMERLSYEPVHIDRLLEWTGMAFGALHLGLANLRKQQAVDELPGNFYLKI